MSPPPPEGAWRKDNGWRYCSSTTQPMLVKNTNMGDAIFDMAQQSRVPKKFQTPRSFNTNIKINDRTEFVRKLKYVSPKRHTGDRLIHDFYNDIKLDNQST